MTTMTDELMVEEAVDQLESNVEANLLPYEECVITVLTGVKGSTKTTNLARIGMMAMSCWRRPTYSNIPIGGYIMGQYYEVEPLPDNFFVTYGRGIEPHSVIIATELGEYFNNQDWQSLQSKMGVSMFSQIRKLNLIIFGDTQFFHHLNPRLTEQVDCLIRCKDLYKTPWGKESHLRKGEEAILDYYDLTGDLSPDGKTARSEFQPNVISGKSYKSEVVYTKAYWEYFNSHKLVALENRFKKFYIEKEKVRVDPISGEAINETTAQQQVVGFLKKIFNDAAASDVEILKASDIYSMLYADGFNISQGRMGIAIKNLGVKGKYYSHHPQGNGVYYQVRDFKNREET